MLRAPNWANGVIGMRRALIAVLVVWLATGCGLMGPSAVDYAKQARDAYGPAPSASPAPMSESEFDKTDMTSAVNDTNHAADLAAQASSKDPKWNALERGLSDVAGVFASVVTNLGPIPGLWDQGERTRMAIDYAPLLATVKAECRKARAS